MDLSKAFDILHNLLLANEPAPPTQLPLTQVPAC